jgi:hypothetical protein
VRRPRAHKRVLVSRVPDQLAGARSILVRWFDSRSIWCLPESNVRAWTSNTLKFRGFYYLTRCPIDRV